MGAMGFWGAESLGFRVDSFSLGSKDPNNRASGPKYH